VQDLVIFERLVHVLRGIRRAEQDSQELFREKKAEKFGIFTFFSFFLSVQIPLEPSQRKPCRNSPIDLILSANLRQEQPGNHGKNEQSGGTRHD
jgi:hypothetical protein